MVADHTRNENPPKLGCHIVEATCNKISKIIDALLGGTVVCLSQLLMNVTPHHVSTQANDNSRVLGLRSSHVIESEINGGVDKFLSSLFSNFTIVGIDATDFIGINNLSKVPV